MDTPYFFRLPRELRDEVYDQLLAGSTFQIEHPDLKVNIYYRNSRDREPCISLPTWLLSSKQILSEGLELLYSRSPGVEYAQVPVVQLAQLHPHHPRNFDVPKIRQIYSACKLLSLHRIRYLELNPIIISYFTPFPIQKPATLYIGGASRLGILKEWIPNPNISRDLRCLIFYFLLDTITDKIYEDRDWKCDLLPLRAISGLERVEFEVKDWEHFRPTKPVQFYNSIRISKDRRASDAAKSRLQMTIQELAPSMIDRTKEECIFTVKDCKSDNAVENRWHLVVQRA